MFFYLISPFFLPFSNVYSFYLKHTCPFNLLLSFLNFSEYIFYDCPILFFLEYIPNVFCKIFLRFLLALIKCSYFSFIYFPADRFFFILTFLSIFKLLVLPSSPFLVIFLQILCPRPLRNFPLYKHIVILISA